MRYFVIFLILFVGLSIMITPEAFACSCIEITEQHALEKSFLSFIGVPVKIESPTGYHNIVTFQIEKSIKNIAENITEITVITSTQESACGYNFVNNIRYLIHTFGEKDQKTFETGLCSRNKNLGFSNISLLVDESVVTNYPESVVGYQFILYLAIAGIISGIIIGVVYIKKKKLKSN